MNQTKKYLKKLVKTQEENSLYAGCFPFTVKSRIITEVANSYG